MPFKKGTSGNPIGRPKGSVSTTSKLIREHISRYCLLLCMRAITIPIRIFCLSTFTFTSLARIKFYNYVF